MKQKIQNSIQAFQKSDVSEAALRLFQTLGYNTSRQNPFPQKTFQTFKESFLEGDTRFNEDRALVKEWRYVDLLFQLSCDEMKPQHDLFDTRQVDRTIIETYLFFAIELTQAAYSRTTLAQISREINKIFPMPVMVLFKYGSFLTLAVINRRLHKRDERKDVLEKVTLIKDISIEQPHRAHIEILFDLSFDELLRKFKFTNFVELHNAWQKTLDTKELNKRFYQELANWYFWAMAQVSFPEDVEKDKNIRNATNLIRLITRVIFIWFIKEKNLVPEALFDRNELRRILKAFHKNNQSHSYYQAILQNLFFGTLNQRMNERSFAREGGLEQNKSEYGVKNLFRYASQFAISETEALALFKDIPFLNGGLFDCLDRVNEEGKVLYSDGFSRNPAKQAKVPDLLFFGSEAEYDLNAIFGTKNKRYKVKGLIDILASYKFTVTENTPIEEEVALDPELLGKVFENLLASYNPETQTTARKQTGSFYTPREIVNYMVDESLKAYLKHALDEKFAIKADDAESRLDKLLAYTELEHAFTQDETRALIEAIDRCKILDPACGSGAFPMGILHKLVHILHKLDPQNRLWKERQIEKARRIDDPAIRDKLIDDIESAFENNELDYGRKLYLIENCIFGVDIQPIAVQIAKLRFFISLVVDQNKEPGKKNLGIRALPNLETRFVAANTLIGLEKPEQMMLRNPKIDEFENDLKDLRHRYFSAKTRKEKLDCQRADTALRQKIAELLMEDGWASDSAKQIVAFDPYDQNSAADWFEPEWMFGSDLKEGFDVVIGNPPYVQIQNFSGMQEQKDWERQKFETYAKTGDIYCLFYERGYQLLRSGGVLTFITSNKWMRANYGKVMRKFLTEKTNPVKIIDFENYSVFDATVNTNIIMIARAKNANYLQAVSIKEDFKETTDIAEYLKTNGVLLKSLGEDSWLISSNEEYAVKKRIEEVGVPLKDWDISINYGIKTGLNEAFIIDGKKKDELIAKDPKSVEIIKPILLGKDIKRYHVEYADLWLINSHNGYTDNSGNRIARVNVKKDYPAIWDYLNRIDKELDGKAEERYDQGTHWTNLRNCAYMAEFDEPKIAWGNLALSSQFAFVEAGFFINAPSPLITPGNKYLLAVLNSKVGNYYIRSLGVTRSGGYFEYKPMFVENLPVPKISDVQHLTMEIFIDCILFCKKKDKESESSILESIIDSIVYELYFPDEIKAAAAEVLKHLTHLPELKDDWSDAQKLEIIEQVYQELSNPSHPVSIAMERQKTVPEVRIIEGLDT